MNILSKMPKKKKLLPGDKGVRMKAHKITFEENYLLFSIIIIVVLLVILNSIQF